MNSERVFRISSPTQVWFGEVGRKLDGLLACMLKAYQKIASTKALA